MNPLDKTVLSLMKSIQNPLLTDIMLVITHIASYSILFLIFLLILFKREKKLAANIFIGILIETLITVGIKFLVGRPRPNGIIKEVAPSFPSGHTSRVTFLSLLFHNKWGKKILWGTFTGLVVFSRLYLRVHYATDIIGGLIVGYITYWLITKYNLGLKITKGLKKKIHNTPYLFKSHLPIGK